MRKNWFRKWLSFVLLVSSPLSEGAYFSGLAGYYSIDADVRGNNVSLANAGSYRLMYFHKIKDYFALNLGYTLMMENSLGGDLSYGVDFGGSWFPFSLSSNTNSKFKNFDIKFDQKWSPYVTLSFHQRQYQSVQSSYTGFGLSLGTIKSFTSSYSFIGDLRYVSLSGPVSATASEVTMSLGVAFNY